MTKKRWRKCRHAAPHCGCEPAAPPRRQQNDHEPAENVAPARRAAAAVPRPSSPSRCAPRRCRRARRTVRRATAVEPVAPMLLGLVFWGLVFWGFGVLGFGVLGFWPPQLGGGRPHCRRVPRVAEPTGARRQYSQLRPVQGQPSCRVVALRAKTSKSAVLPGAHARPCSCHSAVLVLVRALAPGCSSGPCARVIVRCSYPSVLLGALWGAAAEPPASGGGHKRFGCDGARRREPTIDIVIG